MYQSEEIAKRDCDEENTAYVHFPPVNRTGHVTCSVTSCHV